MAGGVSTSLRSTPHTPPSHFNGSNTYMPLMTSTFSTFQSSKSWSNSEAASNLVDEQSAGEMEKVSVVGRRVCPYWPSRYAHVGHILSVAGIPRVQGRVELRTTEHPPEALEEAGEIGGGHRSAVNRRGSLESNVGGVPDADALDANEQTKERGARVSE